MFDPGSPWLSGLLPSPISGTGTSLLYNYLACILLFSKGTANWRSYLRVHFISKLRIVIDIDVASTDIIMKRLKDERARHAAKTQIVFAAVESITAFCRCV